MIGLVAGQLTPPGAGGCYPPMSKSFLRKDRYNGGRLALAGFRTEHQYACAQYRID